MLRIVDSRPYPSIGAVPPRQRLSVQRMLILGAGSVTRAFLPLLQRHFALSPGQVTLVAPDSAVAKLANHYRIEVLQQALSRQNYGSLLADRLGAGDCLVNLALGVGSVDLLRWCQREGVVYLDTNLEPWGDTYGLVHEERSRALSQRRADGPTAVIAHGANPGLVSHLVKQGLCDLAATGAGSPMRVFPDAALYWSSLANRLGVQVIAVTECDDHRTMRPSNAGEFANTWSPRGLMNELCHPAELHWGDHEDLSAMRTVPISNSGAVRVLPRPAGEWKLRSWSPTIGEFSGYLLAHHESISLGAMLAASPEARRPTVFYCYRPCPATDLSTRELRAENWRPMLNMHHMNGELTEGYIELGVLLLGSSFGYWFGSTLTLAAARQITPECNATTLQVAAGVLGGLTWALENPARGIVEAEDMDFRRVLSIAAPYLGQLRGVPTDWRPVPREAGDAGLSFGRFVARQPR